MEQNKFYTLPHLPYDYHSLAPYISEKQLTIHHQKHHTSYVKNANALLDKLDKARKENADIDVKAISKELSFNLGGHLLHSLFWSNLTPPNKNNKPEGLLLKEINKEFGSWERFQQEFT
jgi:Fe-Mn family superoxide dismutase